MYLNKTIVKLKLVILICTMFACLCGCGRIPDGEYAASVTLTGGSGRAFVESPCVVTVQNGRYLADIKWSSPNYDYMIVDGKTYTPVNSEGNSEFVIPITLGKEMKVQADTTAMSTPHLIDYCLTFTILDDKDSKSDVGKSDNETKNGLSGASDEDFASSGKASKTAVMAPPDIPGITYLSTDENTSAACFKIHRYENNVDVITVDDGRIYLLLPDAAKENVSDAQVSTGVTVIKRPLGRIYLAATGAMCHFDSLDMVSAIALSGAERDDWYIESAQKAMDAGTLLYGGKYSAPDYERMVDMDLQLAIESTMILHTPKVQEKLESIGIPVFIDRSSYEKDPVGRLEWIKVYGLLTGKEAEAKAIFEREKALIDGLDLSSAKGKTVAVFAVNSNHQIVTRKQNDYLAKMVEKAGGAYLALASDDADSSSNQMTISLEAFYAYGKDADILIYNGTIQDAPETMDELLQIDSLFADFKAVKEGQVWYTDKSLYQFANKTGTIIGNLYDVISMGKEDTDFFHGLE